MSMDFNYGTSFGARSPSAYETLLVDVMVGDATLYTRQDMVEASWAAVQPILDYRARRIRPNSPTTKPEPGARRLPMRCWRGAVTCGEIRNGSRNVKPERLLKDLGSSGWILGKQDPTGVLRACAMTLIVVVEEAHDAAGHR